MAGDVEGQGDCHTDHFGYFFEIVVDIVAHVAIDAPFVGAGVADYGKEIVAPVFEVFIEDGLHLFCPGDDELLTGFAAPIGYIAVFTVGLFEKRHVDETHASEIEAHKEHVARKTENGSMRKV